MGRFSPVSEILYFVFQAEDEEWKRPLIFFFFFNIEKVAFTENRMLV